MADSKTADERALSLVSVSPVESEAIHETTKTGIFNNKDEKYIDDAASVQAGVLRAEILKAAWSKKALIIAFSGLFLCTLISNFSDYSAQVYVAYATSSFKQHSAMTTAKVVSNIARICTYPIVAKLGDVFGRAEMFVFSITIEVIGYALFAGCQDIGQYFAAAIFDAIGDTGFALTQQVFIADATNLINRGLWSTLPDSITTIPTLYLGTIVGGSVLEHSTWRWGYGMWAIILPFCAVPLVTTMFILQRRAMKNGLTKTAISTITGCDKNDSLWMKAYQLLWVQLDLMGGFLLVAGLSLLLIPLSLTGSSNSTGWGEPSFIAMLVLGVVVLAIFAVWEAKFAQKPFIPYYMVKNRTVAAACLLGALDFVHYAVFSVFFPSYLQVAGGFSPAKSTRIDNSLRVAFQVSGLFVSVFMKYSKRSQIWVLIGVPMCVLGQGIIVYLIDMGDGRSGNEASFVAAKSLIGIGRGFYQTAAQVSVQAVVPKQDVAVATAVFFASMSIGSAVGTSIAGAIWQSTLPRKLKQYLPTGTKSQAGAIFKSIVTAQKYAKGTAARIAIDRSYRESQRLLAIAGVSALAPMLILMWFLKNVHLDEETDKNITDNEKNEARK